jgi:hypothetical protein
LPEELCQAFVVAMHAIVIEIASQFGVQFSEQVSQSKMPVLLAPFGKVLD